MELIAKLHKLFFMSTLALLTNLTPSYGQLSEGQGSVKIIRDGAFKIYVPKYFEKHTQPSGIIHKASGTFIYIIEVPPEQKSKYAGNARQMKSLLVDKNMTNVQWHSAASVNARVRDETYVMSYELQGYAFERINKFAEHKGKKYLILANYHQKIKSQVYEEVVKAIGSLTFLE